MCDSIVAENIRIALLSRKTEIDLVDVLADECKKKDKHS